MILILESGKSGLRDVHQNNIPKKLHVFQRAAQDNPPVLKVPQHSENQPNSC